MIKLGNKNHLVLNVVAPGAPSASGDDAVAGGVEAEQEREESGEAASEAWVGVKGE